MNAAVVLRGLFASVRVSVFVLMACQGDSGGDRRAAAESSSASLEVNAAAAGTGAANAVAAAVAAAEAAPGPCGGDGIPAFWRPCVDCICPADPQCGGPCRELFSCVVKSCAKKPGDLTKVFDCVERNCAMQRAAAGNGRAEVTRLRQCGPSCGWNAANPSP
jgi:hypothetical protein